MYVKSNREYHSCFFHRIVDLIVNLQSQSIVHYIFIMLKKVKCYCYNYSIIECYRCTLQKYLISLLLYQILSHIWCKSNIFQSSFYVPNFITWLFLIFVNKLQSIEENIAAHNSMHTYHREHMPINNWLNDRTCDR